MDWDFFPADVGTAPDAVLAFFAAGGEPSDEYSSVR